MLWMLMLILVQNTSYFIGSALFDEMVRQNSELSDCTVFKHNFSGSDVPPDVNVKI